MMKPNITRVRIKNYVSSPPRDLNGTDGTFECKSQTGRYYEIRCDFDGGTRLFKADEFDIIDPEDVRRTVEASGN
jgi:hypothetical protein